MVGDEIGNFRIVSQLGRGGMGEVWLAEHRDIKTRVAIKLLRAHISSERHHVQRFFNEAVAVSKIKHSGIAKIFDVGFHKEQAFLVMELLEGESLATRIRRLGRVPLAQIADIGAQLVGVLDATHSEGIIHRDLKPDNIFLVEDAELSRGERVKVLDFGIAKLGDAVGLGVTTGTSSLGTPAYMSPEQWRSSASVDGRADLYSLGCVLFEMATGQRPFLAQSMAEMCEQHLHATPPRVRSIAPNVPEALDASIARMLAKQPEARPLESEIKQVLGNLGERASIDETVDAAASPPVVDVQAETQATPAAAPAPRARPAPAPTRRTRRMLIGVGAIALVAGGGFAIHRAQRSPARVAACADESTPLGRARCLHAAGRLGDAIAELERLDRSLPDTRGATLELGRLYAATARFDLAADTFEHYARANTDEDAVSAMRRAAAIREAHGDVPKAIADLRHVVESRISASHAADALLELVDVHVRHGDRAAAIAELRTYVATVGDRGGAGRLLVAHARLAELLWQSSCPGSPVLDTCAEEIPPEPYVESLRRSAPTICGPQVRTRRAVARARSADAREAAASREAATRLYATIADNLRDDDRESLHHYALAKLRDADARFERLLAIPPPRPPTYDAWLANVTTAGEDAIARYKQINQLGGTRASVMAAARSGMIKQRIADAVLSTRIPDDVRANEPRLQAFCDDKQATADRLDAGARTDFAECVSLAAGLGVLDAWFAHCAQMLASDDPTKFPPLAEELPEPRFFDVDAQLTREQAIQRLDASDDVQAYLSLALTDLADKPLVARLVLDEAKRRAPKDGRVDDAQGVLSYRQGDTMAALAAFERSGASVNLAGMYVRLNRFEEARQILQRSSVSYDQLLVAGVASRGVGELADAERLYQQAISHDPQRPEAYFAAGVLYKDFMSLREQDLKQLRRVYEKAIDYYRKAQERSAPRLATKAAEAIGDCSRIVAQLQTQLP